MSAIFIFLLNDSEVVQMPSFLQNPWFLAIWGWVLYNVVRLFLDQNKYDTDENGLGLSEVWCYLKFSWLGMLLSLMLLPLFVPFAHDIWHWSMDLIGKDWSFSSLAYSLVGLIMVAFQYGALWIKEKFSKK